MQETATTKTYAVRTVVDAETEKALKTEQNRIQEATGKRPSVNDVVALWLTQRAKEALAT